MPCQKRCQKQHSSASFSTKVAAFLITRDCLHRQMIQGRAAQRAFLCRDRSVSQYDGSNIFLSYTSSKNRRGGLQGSEKKLFNEAIYTMWKGVHFYLL